MLNSIVKLVPSTVSVAEGTGAEEVVDDKFKTPDVDAEEVALALELNRLGEIIDEELTVGTMVEEIGSVRAVLEVLKFGVEITLDVVAESEEDNEDVDKVEVGEKGELNEEEGVVEDIEDEDVVMDRLVEDVATSEDELSTSVDLDVVGSGTITVTVSVTVDS